MRAARASHKGLTLIEVLLTVALLGILAALALPNANPAIRDQLVATAQVVSADLSFGRSLAVANDSTYRFTFDADENTYTLEHAGTNPALARLPPSLFENSTGDRTRQVVDLDELPHIGPTVRLLGAAVYTQTSVQRITRLEFGPLGETTQPGDVVIWLAAGENRSERYLPLVVNPVTGLVTVGSYSAYGPPNGLFARTAQPST